MTTLQLTAEQILRDWDTHGALWLIEDPNLLDTCRPAFIDAIRAAKKENIAFLCDMAACNEPSYRRMVACHDDIPEDVLLRLSFDVDGGVRANVAMRERTPNVALIKLASDPAWYVRRQVAWNSTSPFEALAMLVNDESKDVRYAAYQHQIVMLGIVKGAPCTPAK